MTTSPTFTLTNYQVAGGSSLGPFSTVWTFEQPSDVDVLVYTPALGPTLLTLGTDYTLSAPSPLEIGGTVTLQAAVLTTYSTIVPGTWDPGVVVVLVRATSESQPSALGAMAVFSPSVYEAALDHLSRQIQDTNSLRSQTLQLPLGEAAPVLPPAIARAGKLLGFDPTSAALPVMVSPGDFIVDAATLSFATVTIAAAAIIPAGTPFLQVMGFYAAGDCPPAVYVPAAGGAALGKFQSADGAWWAVSGSDVGYPEWFGAVGNNSGHDCLAALSACVAQFAVTRLSAKQYFINSTWSVSLHNKKIQGTSLNITLRANAGEACAQVVINSATEDCMFVGFESSPGSDGAFLRGFEMDNVALNRSTAPTPPATVGFTGPGPFAGPAGLRMQYVINAHLKGVISNEHYYGFYLYAVVASYFDTCSGDRLSAGSTPTNDGFAAWFLDASATGVGVDGIASLYMNRCSGYNTFGLFGPTAFSHSIYTYEGFTDLYIMQFEGTSTVNGATLNASPSGSTEDLHMDQCVFDSMTNIGIGIFGNGSDPCVFDIAGCYVANSSGYAGAIGYAVNNVPGGHGVFRGGQIVGNGGTPMIGLSVVASGEVDMFGTQMTQVQRPVVADGAFGGKWDFNAICNFASGVDAVHLTASTRVTIEPRLNLTGGSAAWVNGVNISDTSSGYNEVRVTGINPAACSGHKLIYDDAGTPTPITAETAIGGQFGTQNIARGVFA